MEIARTAEGLDVRFEADETAVLRNLLTEMEQLLRMSQEDDPVRARLFPDAYETGPEQDAYDELVGEQLHDEKLRAVRQVRDDLAEEVSIARGDVDRWLVVLTDLRLGIGTRLDVTEEVMSRDLDPEDPNVGALSVLHWLGWVQETMLAHII